ncbi:MAG TPA: nuclear transport factor 2 family protein [Terriglobales bacterium]
MAEWIGCACLALVIASYAPAQSPQPSSAPSPSLSAKTPAKTLSPLEALLEANVKSEWDAFKNKDRAAYSNLLAEDFAAVEDDNQGMRTKSAVTAEVDHSVIDKYFLFALHVVPLASNAALVTYELTMLFPPKAAVRFKRVLVSELWLKRDGQWKMRYYQETHVR